MDKVGDKPVFTIYLNMTIYRIVILMDTGYELDLTQGDCQPAGIREKDFERSGQFCGR